MQENSKKPTEIAPSNEDSSESEDKISYKEERIRKITNLYYSRKDVQEAIFEFSNIGKFS
jgi:hypothetical protein